MIIYLYIYTYIDIRLNIQFESFWEPTALPPSPRNAATCGINFLGARSHRRLLGPDLHVLLLFHLISSFHSLIELGFCY